MKAKLIEWAIKALVKYLRDHPELIPGRLDEAGIGILARLLGV